MSASEVPLGAEGKETAFLICQEVDWMGVRIRIPTA